MHSRILPPAPLDDASPIAPGSPIGEIVPRASALQRGVQMVTDLSNVLRQEAAQCRRLVELVTEQAIRQELMEMAARLQALADEIDEP
jgi:hypothetical protein